ncbi:MAG TPA: hypothetical protein VHB20_05375 [Verrucomicrobiae bacterium]|jgi:hypothetical protein|nr:hypothetical protein [Verrucomicrobiae bacterium]
MKKKTWSRKKISDQYTGMVKADGSPMSRQQVHMLRKKARGICLTCGQPAIGVYCLKHTVAARERMRQKLKYRRRLKQSPSYLLEKEVRTKGKARRPGRATGPVNGRLNARSHRTTSRSKAVSRN